MKAKFPKIFNTVSPEPRSAFANSVYFDSSRGSTATNTSTFLPNPQGTVNISGH